MQHGQLVEQFDGLVQGNMSVKKFYVRFMELDLNAYELGTNEVFLVEKFENRLR